MSRRLGNARSASGPPLPAGPPQHAPLHAGDPGPPQHAPLHAGDPGEAPPRRPTGAPRKGRLRRFAPAAFAQDWVAAWNRGDLEAVLAWFAEDAVFVSATAAAVTGRAEVRGKAALRAYWARALRSLPAPLHFELDSFFWDAARRAILIVFLSAERAGTVRKAELMQFGGDGLIVRGEGLAGAAL